MGLRKLLQRLSILFTNHPVVILLLALVLAYMVTVSVIATCDQVSLADAAIRGLPAFLGELGEPQSSSLAVKVVVLVSLFSSIAFLAIITGAVTTGFVQFAFKGGRIVKQVNLSDHIVICGWNFQGERILQEILVGAAQRDIAILAKLERRPVKEDRVLFVSGDPTQDDDLIRAGVKRAESVIILSDISKPDNEADAAALMITLAVESLNRGTHTSVQVRNAENRIHLERAHADEIICLDQMGGSLVVASTTNHGISHVMNELLTFNSGSEFYRYDKRLSDKIVGMEFAEAIRSLAESRIILIGIETMNSDELQTQLSDDVFHPHGEDNRVIIVNPQGQYRIRQGDALFLVAESLPERL